MDEKLKKDLLDVLSKHGLKADDIESESKETVEETEKSETTVDKKVVADLASSIAEKIAAAISEKKDVSEGDKKDLEKEVKTRIYTSFGGMKEVSYPSDLGNLSKEEKIVTFFKALFYSKSDPKSEQVLRALTETDSEGGYLVPEELRAEVFRMLPDLSVMRKIARVIPMASDTLKLNSLTARPVAYWTAEYGSKSTTSAEFGQVTLSPNDLVCLIPISDQLLADANIDLVQFITQLFTEAIAVAEDKAFFTGSGTGQPKGINQESLSSIAAGGNVSFNHVISLMDAVPQRVTQAPGAAFVAHRKVKAVLRGLKDLNGMYIWRDGGPANNGETRRLPDTLYGYPFYEQNDLSQSELYFGDWMFYIIGDRQTVSVQTTNVGGDAWRHNSTEIKAVERVDGKVVMTTPFAKITGI